MAKLEDLGDEAPIDFTDAPKTDEIEELSKLGVKLVNLDAEIEYLNKKLEEVKKQRLQVAMIELPEFMTKVGQDKIGLAGVGERGVDLVLENYYHANIASDWEPERREAAFKWLEESGNGDLIKTVLSMAFPRREYDRARVTYDLLCGLINMLMDAGLMEGEPPEPKIEMTVPWNTLTAFVREQTEKGEALPLETLGATVGRIVKIKPRKK